MAKFEIEYFEVKTTTKVVSVEANSFEDAEDKLLNTPINRTGRVIDSNIVIHVTNIENHESDIKDK
jgi:hypothetical protein